MKQAKRNSLRSFLLAVLFYIFFESSKHRASVVRVNPFAEDPYDTVGSFAVQLALFLGLLALLRAFRPYKGNGLPEDRVYLVGGCLLSAMSICLTMASNIVALLRHLSMWVFSWEGRLLAAVTAGFLLLGCMEYWKCWREITVRHSELAFSRKWAGVLSGVCVAGALSIYPEGLRQSLTGEIITVLVGITMLFLPLRLTARTIMAKQKRLPVDLVDDVIAVCEGIKERLPQFRSIFIRLDRLQRARWSQKLAESLDPRRHGWRISLLIGGACGLALATAELLPGGVAHISKTLLVMGVFMGLESAGVLMGFGLLATPLGLFRQADKHEPKV